MAMFLNLNRSMDQENIFANWKAMKCHWLKSLEKHCCGLVVEKYSSVGISFSLSVPGGITPASRAIIPTSYMRSLKSSGHYIHIIYRYRQTYHSTLYIHVHYTYICYNCNSMNVLHRKGPLCSIRQSQLDVHRIVAPNKQKTLHIIHTSFIVLNQHSIYNYLAL